MILCPSCDSILPSWLLRSGQTQNVCPSCFHNISVEVFPALFRQRQELKPEQLQVAEGEACCYEHSTKRAVEACHRCGRFLCALCEVQVEGRVWCPACLQPGSDKPVRAIESTRVLYDSIALALALWPILTIYFTVLTAPATLFVAIRFWKRPSSLVPRNKWRLVVAVCLALAELGLLTMLVIAIVVQVRRTTLGAR